FTVKELLLMTIEYELSGKECLEFISSNISKTKTTKKIIRQFAILYLLFELLIISIYSKPISFFFGILILFLILSSKKIYLYGFKKRFKTRLLENSISIIFDNLILNVSNDFLIAKAKYEHLFIPFDKINSIYISTQYIFIFSKISKDILIPIKIFNSIEDIDVFLKLFQSDNINITRDFPKDYSFIC
ncbi:MAG: hypothetical protein RR523_14715, partial [Cetobacterium sp.]